MLLMPLLLLIPLLLLVLRFGCVQPKSSPLHCAIGRFTPILRQNRPKVSQIPDKAGHTATKFQRKCGQRENWAKSSVKIAHRSKWTRRLSARFCFASSARHSRATAATRTESMISPIDLAGDPETNTSSTSAAGASFGCASRSSWENPRPPSLSPNGGTGTRATGDGGWCSLKRPITRRQISQGKTSTPAECR